MRFSESDGISGLRITPRTLAAQKRACTALRCSLLASTVRSAMPLVGCESHRLVETTSWCSTLRHQRIVDNDRDICCCVHERQGQAVASSSTPGRARCGACGIDALDASKVHSHRPLENAHGSSSTAEARPLHQFKNTFEVVSGARRILRSVIFAQSQVVKS